LSRKGIAVGIIALSLLSVGLTGCGENSDPGVKADTGSDTTTSEDGENKEDTTTEEEDSEVVDNTINEEYERLLKAEEAEKTDKIVYVISKGLSLRTEGSSKASTVDRLLKGTELEIIEEVKNPEDDSLWYKVKGEKDGNPIEGFFLASDTVQTKTELLQAVYPDLDYAPQNKAYEYPDNPRVEVKGIYMTKHTASGKRLDDLIEMTKRTNINTFVIDVKDDNGQMLFYSETAAEYAPDANKQIYIKDMEAFMQKLKDNNIYAIARIVSFKDGIYSKTHPDRAIIRKSTGEFYTNSDKLIWATAYDRELWKYNIGVAKEAAKWGFNEIQFDYVRFPASNGGKLDKDLDYKNKLDESKPKAIQEFLKYAREELSPLNVYISADVYGMVGTTNNDMGLGQYWEAVSNVTDYISPMMYPSHYGYGEYGLAVPDAQPYNTIYHSTKDSVERDKNIKTPATIRPWIQDFTATWVKGYIKYGEKEVREQIKALEDNGVKEFLLWNAGNKYTEDAVK